MEAVLENGIRYPPYTTLVAVLKKIVEKEYMSKTRMNTLSVLMCALVRVG